MEDIMESGLRVLVSLQFKRDGKGRGVGDNVQVCDIVEE
jgi:hypothetical protein